MAESHPPRTTNAPAAKTRSPIERVIVWGLIGALAVAAGFEFLSKRGHETALKTLQDKVAAVDEDAKHPDVTEDDVKKAVGDKKPSKTKDYGPGEVAANGAKRMELYTWFTLNPSNTREMYVWYTGKGKDGKEVATVLEVQSTETISGVPKLTAGPDGPPSGEAQAAEGGGAGSFSMPPGGSQPGVMGGPAGGMRGRGMNPPGGGQRGRPATEKPDDSTAADKDEAKPAEDDKPAADAPEEKKTEDKEDKSE